MIIANSTDLIIAMTRSMGYQYQKFYLDGTHEILMNRISDAYTHQDKTLVIGALANVFLLMPQVAMTSCDAFLNKVDSFFNDSNNIDENLLRNTSFAIGALAESAP